MTLFIKKGFQLKIYFTLEKLFTIGTCALALNLYHINNSIFYVLILHGGIYLKTRYKLLFIMVKYIMVLLANLVKRLLKEFFS